MSANRCPNCDFDELEPDDAECPACGYALTRPNRLWLWLGAGAVAALLIGAVMWAIPSSRPAGVPVVPAGPAQPAVPGSAAAITAQVLPGVVSIRVTSADQMGSGWVWDGSGLIITNAHVVAGAREVTVVSHTGKEYNGKVLGRDRTWDIAVVQVGATGDWPALPLGDSTRVRPGDEVLAFGSPLGLENTVTGGLISAVRTNVPTDSTTLARVFQTSAAIAPGSSGGPLVDKATGRVIGVNTAGVSAAEAANIGFAVPVDAAVEAAKRITSTPGDYTRAGSAQFAANEVKVRKAR